MSARKPKVVRCGHSACAQHHIDTGRLECIAYPAYVVVCSDGLRKPDWWNFDTRKEAREFARGLRAPGWKVTVRKRSDRERGIGGAS